MPACTPDPYSTVDDNTNRLNYGLDHYVDDFNTTLHLHTDYRKEFKMADDLAEFMDSTGTTMEDMAPLSWDCVTSMRKLFEAVKPGDHVAVSTGLKREDAVYWHHGIFWGTDTDGEPAVIDIMPERHVMAVSWDDFVRGYNYGVIVPTSTDDLRHQTRVRAYKALNTKPPIQYHVPGMMCDTFAFYCQTGRRVETLLMPHPPAGWTPPPSKDTLLANSLMSTFLQVNTKPTSHEAFKSIH